MKQIIGKVRSTGRRTSTRVNKYETEGVLQTSKAVKARSRSRKTDDGRKWYDILVITDKDSSRTSCSCKAAIYRPNRRCKHVVQFLEEANDVATGIITSSEVKVLDLSAALIFMDEYNGQKEQKEQDVKKGA